MTTVLVVEDDVDTAATLRTLLTRAGYHPTVVGTAQEAIEVASADAPDVVLADRRLPDGDGLALCRRLRGAGLAGRVVLLTGDALESGQRAGLDAYLLKPAGLRELLAALDP
jgi:DNA-binding response OmpR family regulator